MATFDDRKKTVLDNIAGGCDNSSIGKIDARVVELCDLINRSHGYVTTSSCTGRISIYWEGLEDKKRCGKWLLVSHDPLDPKSLRRSMQEVPPGEGLTLFKYEGFVIHVEARTLDAARELLTVALACGYKNSGLVIGKRFMVGIRGTLKVDAPIAEDGRWVVTEEYLELLGRLANEKFAENDTRLTKFQAAVQELLTKPQTTKSKKKSLRERPPAATASTSTAQPPESTASSQYHDPADNQDIPYFGLD